MSPAEFLEKASKIIEQRESKVASCLKAGKLAEADFRFGEADNDFEALSKQISPDRFQAMLRFATLRGESKEPEGIVAPLESIKNLAENLTDKASRTWEMIIKEVMDRIDLVSVEEERKRRKKQQFVLPMSPEKAAWKEKEKQIFRESWIRSGGDPAIVDRQTHSLQESCVIQREQASSGFPSGVDVEQSASSNSVIHEANNENAFGMTLEATEHKPQVGDVLRKADAVRLLVLLARFLPGGRWYVVFSTSKGPKKENRWAEAWDFVEEVCGQIPESILKKFPDRQAFIDYAPTSGVKNYRLKPSSINGLRTKEKDWKSFMPQLLTDKWLSERELSMLELESGPRSGGGFGG